MDGKRVLFVTQKQTLITSALANKIKLRGAEVVCAEEPQQLAGQAVDSVVYCMGDDMSACAALHDALDACCARQGVRVVCVGTQEQYDAFLEHFPAAHAAGFFGRPLDMERFLGCVLGAPGEAARRKRVLIVDDDASYRAFVRDWLRSVYDVAMANGGEQALKVLSAQKCDLILLDYEMPGLSGPETLEKLRELPASEQPPVLFLTGNEDEEFVRELLALHPAGCLAKSTCKEKLLAKTAELLAD